MTTDQTNEWRTFVSVFYLFGYTVHCIHLSNTIHGSFSILSRCLGDDTVTVYMGYKSYTLRTV